jgi:DNA-directed RNA polymerase specialized sigma24 family protein
MFNPNVDLITAANPRFAAERARRARQVRHFLAVTLDPLERSVFALRYRDEMPLETIAGMLGLHSSADAANALASAQGKIAKATNPGLRR